MHKGFDLGDSDYDGRRGTINAQQKPDPRIVVPKGRTRVRRRRQGFGLVQNAIERGGTRGVRQSIYLPAKTWDRK